MMAERMQVYFEGRVQGVGFRYSAKGVARGFDLTGWIRNLPDGRVEMQAEGERGELEAFLEALRDSHLGGFIRRESVSWLPASGGLRGFQIEL
jgi:acylphosphatase